ncbi:DUF6660 family protein [Pedobacter sp. UC225_65]|uniref:DUF6660 family protein n=1 Tax=Pedobacter sp. UC225_65 TaxID=3350173 RepID=UPI0036708A06
MKNLGIFYLILVVLLSALPCSDELSARDFTQNIIAKVEHGKQEGSTEACSPICLCTCCGQSVVATSFINFSIEVPIAELIAPIASYEFALQQRPVNIWQPPKLAVNS